MLVVFEPRSSLLQISPPVAAERLVANAELPAAPTSTLPTAIGLPDPSRVPSDAKPSPISWRQSSWPSPASSLPTKNGMVAFENVELSTTPVTIALPAESADSEVTELRVPKKPVVAVPWIAVRQSSAPAAPVSRTTRIWWKSALPMSSVPPASTSPEGENATARPEPSPTSLVMTFCHAEAVRGVVAIVAVHARMNRKAQVECRFIAQLPSAGIAEADGTRSGRRHDGSPRRPHPAPRKFASQVHEPQYAHLR